MTKTEKAQLESIAETTRILAAVNYEIKELETGYEIARIMEVPEAEEETLRAGVLAAYERKGVATARQRGAFAAAGIDL